MFSLQYRLMFVLKKHVMFAVTESLTRNLFKICSPVGVFFYKQGTETTENRLLDLLRHFLYDFFVANVSTIKMLCSTQQFMFMNGKNVLHNKNHFVFTIHDKQYTSVTLSM